jgi:anti-anti-sigma factor
MLFGGALYGGAQITYNWTDGRSRMMTREPHIFEIHESQAEGWLRLSLTGDLDLGSAPVLEDRLTRLRIRKRPVKLDLSQLDFIDSTGLRSLIRTVGDARLKRWELQIERELSPEVERLFKLVHIEHLVFDGDATKPPAE